MSVNALKMEFIKKFTFFNLSASSQQGIGIFTTRFRRDRPPSSENTLFNCILIVNKVQKPLNCPDPDCPKKALDQSQNMAAGSGVVGAGEADLELRKIGGPT